jgi:hypothetical protein
MKHSPFESIYRQNFEVVEQRQGKVTLFPHTDQLPLLFRALNLEFHGGLPGRIARVDHRADGFHKIVLRTAAMLFCNSLNCSRSDRLRLFCLINPDLVAKVAIVQQITESAPLGSCHRFRFYAGDFFPEIRLGGKRLVFADHVLQRFSARVPNNIGEDLSSFVTAVFGSPAIDMPCGRGRALIFPWGDSLLALPYKETRDDFFVMTCLTVNEINALDIEMPPQTFNLHYGSTFAEPEVRNWIPTAWAADLFQRWDRRSQLPPPGRHLEKKAWHRVGHLIKDILLKQGFGPGSRICFLDNIPGPCVLEIRPGDEEPRINELVAWKKTHPGYNWDVIVARRKAQRRAAWESHPETHEKHFTVSRNDSVLQEGTETTEA